MAIEDPQNEEIFRGGKNGGRKEVGSAIHRERANRRVFTLRKESDEEMLGDVDPYIIIVGINRKKRGGRKFRK